MSPCEIPSRSPPQAFPVILGVVTLAASGLLAQDSLPGLSPAWSHACLGGFFPGDDRRSLSHLRVGASARAAGTVKAVLLAAAFLFWAANQFWPNLPQAVLFNDIAMALFVFDVFLVIAGWPPASERPFFRGTWLGGALLRLSPIAEDELRSAKTVWRNPDRPPESHVMMRVDAKRGIRRDIFYVRNPNLWYARRQRNDGVFPAFIFVTMSFLFRALQSDFAQNFFAISHANACCTPCSVVILKFRASPPAPAEVSTQERFCT